ncbi:MAG: hypothetical protein AAGH87_07850 [Pseudomonadota bacterium]
MRNLFVTVAASALIAGCGQNTDAPVDVEDTVERGGEAAIGSAQRALADLGNITLRGGDASEAADALAAMFLDTSGSGRISFETSDTNGDGATFSGVTIDIPGGNSDGDGAQLLVGTLELDGLDMVDGGASFSKLSLDAIEIVPNDPGDAEDGTLTISNIEVLNPSPALASWFASLGGTGEPAEFPGLAEVAFDSMAMSDMAFDLSDGSDNVAFNLAGLQFGGASETGLALARVEGITLDAESKGDDPVSLRLGSLAMTGVGDKIVSAIEAGIASGVSDMAESSQFLEAVYANPLEPGYDTITVDDLAFDIGGVAFALPGANSMVVRDADGVATGTETEEFTATLSADPEAGKSGAELAGALGMMGYEEIKFTAAGKTQIDQETDTVVYDAAENFYAIEDGFTLRFGADMSGISEYSSKLAAMDLSDPSGDPAMFQEAASALSFKALTVQLEDDSIVDRGFNLYAAQSGEDPGEARQQAINMMQLAPMMAGGMGVDMSIATEFSTAIAAFLTDPGTLTISLDPEKPLSVAAFSEMKDPSMITKDFLGLSVTHE